MTETTSIQHFTRARQTYAPVVRQPGLATFIAQAAIGSFCGSFLVLIARILLEYHSFNGFFVFYVPFLMALGLATGSVAGFLIWAATKEVDGPLLGITRSLIGVFVMGLAWFALWSFVLRDDFSADVHLWLFLGVVVSGMLIGAVTNSRLRVWRELVRGGETKTTLLRILAGFIGLVLRVVFVCLFLLAVIGAIATVQFYLLGPQPPYAHLRIEIFWMLLLLGYTAFGVVVLFARMKFWSLVILTVLANSPLLASLCLQQWNPDERLFIIGYLGVWALFLLTRWRQTDVAWSYLEAEFRYYLID